MFIWGYSFLKGRDLFVDYKTFYVTYDNIEGLPQSAIVTLNGFNIGKVSNMTLDKKTGKILIELQLKSDFPISKTSIAEIYAPSPIGGKQIAIIPDTKNSILAEEKDFLIGATKLGLTDQLGKEIVPVKEKVERLLENANTMILNLNGVMDTRTKENLKSSLENLNQTLAEFKIASKSVNGILDNNKAKLNTTFTNVDKMTKNFASLSDTLSKIKIANTLKSLEKTLANVDKIMAGMQAGKGTMGKLLTDESLYKNFNKTSKELELLLQDLRLQPTRYVNVSLFGKKNKPYVAPTDTIKK